MNRRFSFLLLVMALVMALASALPTLAQGGVTVVANANLNLRASPNSGAAVLATVPWETELPATALSEDRNWVAVLYGAQGGWLSLTYTGVVSGSLGSLPISNQVFTAGGSGQVTSSVVVEMTINLRYRFQPTLDVQPAGAIPYQTQVPALGLSGDGLFVLVHYNGQDVWVYRQYVVEVVGSLNSFVPGAAPSASTVATDLLEVCAGGSAPDAAPYAGGPGLHPVMALSTATNSLHSWNNQLGAWTSANPTEIQLVACIGQETRVEIEECYYNGPNIHRYVFRVPVQLRAATTGQVIASTTLEGTPPRNCRQTEPYYLVTLEGQHVSYTDFSNWARGYVNP